MKGFTPMFSVCMFSVAPKAPEPLVEVPAPRCSCMLCTEEAKSPILTKYTCELSASLRGMPLAVMLILEGSTPRTRMEV